MTEICFFISNLLLFDHILLVSIRIAVGRQSLLEDNSFEYPTTYILMDKY